jgi:hypothetical protein
MDLMGISPEYDGFARLHFNFSDQPTLEPESHRTVNRRTKHLKSLLPKLVSQAEITLPERHFDRSPDVAFFVKESMGRHVALPPLTITTGDNTPYCTAG